MKVYFDTEFTGLKKDTTLVSIGLISETHKAFYAEFTDYDKTYKDQWFKDNVEKNLLYGTDKWGKDLSPLITPESKYFIYGNKSQIKTRISEYFSSFESVELVSDVCHYDMVLLIDIFGTAFDLPKNVSSVCYDINQDIARFCKITNSTAFDINREELLEILMGMKLPIDIKHNSLYDAFVIMAIYKNIELSEKAFYSSYEELRNKWLANKQEEC